MEHPKESRYTTSNTHPEQIHHNRTPFPSQTNPYYTQNYQDSIAHSSSTRNELALGYDSLLGHHPSQESFFARQDSRHRPSTPPSSRKTSNTDERRREPTHPDATPLPDLPYQSRPTFSPSNQPHSGSSIATATQGDSYFPINGQPNYDRERSTSRFASSAVPIPTPSSSSSSSASAALLMSPLSPHVAPFSPATASSSGSGGGSLPWSNSRGSFSGPSERVLPTSPPLDLRSYPLQAQAQQQQQLYLEQQHQRQRDEDQFAFERERNFDDQHTPLAPRTSQALPPHDLRKFANIAALGLTGVPEYGAPVTGDSTSSLSYLQQQPASSASSQFSTTAYGFEDVPSGSWSATMSASDSREGYRRDFRSNGFGEVVAARSAGVALSVGGSLTGGNDSSVEGGNSEEISTIFVVGFPDDMQEREFQNMFVLSSGFEAATLKIPVGTKEREILKATSSTTGDRATTQDPYGGMLGNDGAHDDAFVQSEFSNGPNISSHPLSNTSGALAATRSAAGSPAPSRKQIIGFAKFRTRAQALDARDLLSGKKVDAEKGSILKAEMAKKNLHTKRGISNEIAAGTPLASIDPVTLSRLANTSTLNPAVLAELSRQNAVAQQQQVSTNSMPTPALGLQSAAAFDAFHSVPSHYPSAPLRRERETTGTANFPLPGAATATRLRDRQPTNAEHYYEDSASPIAASTPYYSVPRQNENFPGSVTSPPLQQQQQFQASLRERNLSGDFGDEHAQNVLPHGGWTGKSMMQQLDEGNQDINLEHQRMATNQQMYQQQQSQAQFQNQQHQQLQSPLPPPSQFAPHDPYRQPIQNQYATGPPHYQNDGFVADDRTPFTYQQQGMMAPRPPASMAMGISPSANSIPRTQNPADMNAPKNTLYVGGLPAVLPSLTGPFSAAHLEDSLRNAFSRCPGFRRLCFRSKSNGPIVFVEFDDVIFATRALQEMYGNQLGGIVKGGIRLSYSKNPLGVRAGSISNGSGSPGSLAALSLNAPSDNIFTSSLYGNSTPTVNRRPSESIFGPGIDYRQTGTVGLGMGARVASGGYGNERFGSTFSPFGVGYDQN